MTRIYKNCREALDEIKRDLYEMGTEVHSYSYQNKIVEGNSNFTSKELQATSFVIKDTSDKDQIVFDLVWCHQEFMERISGMDCNPGEAWKLRHKVWEQFLNKKGEMDYTYASRFKNQLPKIINELKIHPETRQAILEVHNNLLDIDSMGSKARLPCSLSYHFMIRKDNDGIPRLNLIYMMRSCDFYTHFRNDIWLAAQLRDYVAEKIGVKTGTFTMFISSLHMFAKDMEKGVY